MKRIPIWNMPRKVNHQHQPPIGQWLRDSTMNNPLCFIISEGSRIPCLTLNYYTKVQVGFWPDSYWAYEWSTWFLKLYKVVGKSSSKKGPFSSLQRLVKYLHSRRWKKNFAQNSSRGYQSNCAPPVRKKNHHCLPDTGPSRHHSLRLW